jgi:hypothetical protein
MTLSTKTSFSTIRSTICGAGALTTLLVMEVAAPLPGAADRWTDFFSFARIGSDSSESESSSSSSF